MSRRNWLPILAIVGLTFLTGAGQPQKSPPSEGTSGHAQQIRPSPAPALSAETYTPYPEKNSDKCYDAKDHDAADLCAQWRAAIGAEKAANAAITGNWISAIAAVLSTASLFAVVFSLMQTKAALGIAHATLDVAERPWLRVNVTGIGTRFDDFLSDIDIENYGDSPAINIEVRTNIVFDQASAEDRLDQMIAAVRAGTSTQSPRLFRNIYPSNDRDEQRLVVPYAAAEIASAVAARGHSHVHVILVGVASYRSIFSTEVYFTGFIEDIANRDLGGLFQVDSSGNLRIPIEMKHSARVFRDRIT